MDFDMLKASSRLSELDLKITSDSLGVNVLWFRVMPCNCDSVVEKHTHSTYEFHFVFKGTSIVEVDDKSFTVREGEFYLTAPGIFHRQQIQKGYIEFSLNCELINLKDQASEAEYLIGILRNADCRPVSDGAEALKLFSRVLEEAYYRDTGFYNNICSLTTQLVTAAARAISGFIPAHYSVPAKQKKNAYRFQQIRDYIRDNISLPISAADISRHMFIGEKQVYRIVKEAAGISTKELIQDIKFQTARKMLIERQDLTIRQIAELLGFSSEYYFNQFFKRLEGYPPGIFRVNVRNS